MFIGVGITTRNRNDQAKLTKGIIERLTPSAKVVVVDDASTIPVEWADFRFDINAGIARAKNKCLELLDDCQHIFLFDDDTYPDKEDWWRPYVESREPHALYGWWHVIYEDEHIIAYNHPNGCMVYVERRVLDIVGGLDVNFGLFGHEHVSWSDRIHNAGLTTARYQNVQGGRVYSMDEHEAVESTIPEHLRKNYNWALAERSRYSNHYVPYREGYNMSTAATASGREQQLAQEAMFKRAAKPVVDVVMLSKADSYQIRDMTQKAIDSCLKGAGRHSVNIIVMEQNKTIKYRDAITVHNPGPFNYNRTANTGIRSGKAQWVVVANNDLLFHDGWLDALLRANLPVMSPVSPNLRHQARYRVNTPGFATGVHFSGWCFMMKRSVWEEIGGLDEDFVFWCADDATIEQVKAIGITPVLVPRSKVEHLVSKTIGPGAGRAEDKGDLTWAMIRKFEDKYGPHGLNKDPRYLKWQQQYGT
jgi:GT2 family glycosyltransferase